MLRIKRCNKHDSYSKTSVSNKMENTNTLKMSYKKLNAEIKSNLFLPLWIHH